MRRRIVNQSKLLNQLKVNLHVNRVLMEDLLRDQNKHLNDITEVLEVIGLVSTVAILFTAVVKK
jgi:hypothetical protein